MQFYFQKTKQLAHAIVGFLIIGGNCTMAVIDDEGLKKFIESDISDGFGLSISEVAEQAKEYGRFSEWLNSDVARIKEVLQAVKDEGVSPAFFASYEKTEGYNSSWGWLNHTSPQGSPLEDAISVAQWIVEQSNNMNDSPAWIDFANYKDFVPEDVKQAGNAHYESISKGSIGRVVIAGTAAATWEVYYPKGLLKEYNGVQDYGKPLTGMKDTIKTWGGDIEGGDGSKPCFPTSSESVLTSPWGYRILDGVRDFHAGADYASPSGTSQPIYATQYGTVIQSGWLGSAGNAVTIKHSGDRYYSRYMHMIDTPLLEVGEQVSKCQHIGNTGNTGNSRGIHLHFEIAPSESEFGKNGNTIDPELYLDMSFSDDKEKSKYKYWLYSRNTNMRRMGVRGRVR